jgi:hypothetical protein
VSEEEVVKKTEIAEIRGRPKHSQTYDRWFERVLTLKDDEALRIKLHRKSKIPLPSAAAVRFAVKRWNEANPDQKIKQVLKNSRSDDPVIYLFREKEEGLRQKKSRKA